MARTVFTGGRVFDGGATLAAVTSWSRADGSSTSDLVSMETRPSS
jgi:hypothetical protein